MSKYQFLPPLKDEKEFESLVNDLCAEKYNITFQVYGRKGQKQSGIDGLSFSKDKKQIVYQCKNKLVNRDDKKIQAELLDDIDTEVKSASAEFPRIDTFIFATSFKQDTVLQDKATKLTDQYGFTVIVWSWEEIEGLLEKHLNVAKQYYPEIFDKNILSEKLLSHPPERVSNSLQGIGLLVAHLIANFKNNPEDYLPKLLNLVYAKNNKAGVFLKNAIVNYLSSEFAKHSYSKSWLSNKISN